jgi:hypothetical protein
MHSYYGLPDRKDFDRLNGFIGKGSFRVEISKTYMMED